MGILPKNEYPGADHKKYLDLAVDHTLAGDMIVWLRRRKDDTKYFIVAALICGHFMKKEIQEEEALELYHAMRDRLPYREAFPDRARPRKALADVADEPPPVKARTPTKRRSRARSRRKTT